ncbi:helix-hairpin-helix domain-containing protein [Glutamicibacter sp. X7]
MGRHDLFSSFAPRPARLRFAVSRIAVLALLAAVLTWMVASLLISPPPRSEAQHPLPLREESSQPQGPQDTTSSAPGDSSTTQSPPEGAVVMVHVVGAVKNPGVYRLRKGERAIDAVTAAGGLRKDAEDSGLNLAAVLIDGSQLYIPTHDETTQRRPDGPGPAAPVTSHTQELIPLNSADAQQLEQLPGIGPTLAERIIDFRTEHGGFRDIAELDAVPGIGPVLFERLKDRVSVP